MENVSAFSRPDRIVHLCRQLFIPVRAGASVAILRHVHPSDCLSACCGLPLPREGNFDSCRYGRLLLVVVALRCRRSWCGHPGYHRERRDAVGHGPPRCRALRALRPASADCFFSFFAGSCGRGTGLFRQAGLRHGEKTRMKIAPGERIIKK